MQFATIACAILTRILSQVQAEATRPVVVAFALPLSQSLLLSVVSSLSDSLLLHQNRKGARLHWTRLHPFKPVTLL